MTFDRDEHKVIACFICSIEPQSFKKSSDCFIDLCKFIGYSHLDYAESTLESLNLTSKISMRSLIVAIIVSSDTNDRIIYFRLDKTLILSASGEIKP